MGRDAKAVGGAVTDIGTDLAGSVVPVAVAVLTAGMSEVAKAAHAAAKAGFSTFGKEDSKFFCLYVADARRRLRFPTGTLRLH